MEGLLARSCSANGTPFVVNLRRLIAAFDPNHCGGWRIGLENTHAVAFPLPTGVPMFSHAHQNLTEPLSRGYGRIGGYLLVAMIAVLVLVVLLTNPVLP
jgi:hypothetical protein